MFHGIQPALLREVLSMTREKDAPHCQACQTDPRTAAEVGGTRKRLPDEYPVEAVSLLYFTQPVEWPAQTAHPQTPFVIGVLGIPSLVTSTTPCAARHRTDARRF